MNTTGQPINFNFDSFLLWGLIATVLLTTITSLSQWRGCSRMGLPFILGTVFTANRDRAQIIGFVCHLLLGWLFALPYALIFQSWQWSSWWMGMIMGMIHGLFVLAVALPLLTHIHPRMASEYHGPTPTRMLEPPGYMALNYGHRTPSVLLLGHLAYGGVLGAFYQISGG